MNNFVNIILIFFNIFLVVEYSLNIHIILRKLNERFNIFNDTQAQGEPSRLRVYGAALGAFHESLHALYLGLYAGAGP
jgi:hypothetical protein